MTSPSHTCSEPTGTHPSRLARGGSGALLLALWAVVPSLAGTVTGSVRLMDSHDPAVRKNNNYYGVVIWLERTDGAAPSVQPKTAQMAQRKKSFVPSVLAVPAGSTVSFPNFDPIFHNVFSNYAGQVFDVGLYAPGTDQKVVFRRAGIVRVFCNIHPTMSAVIVVVDTPYMAVSNPDGSFRIDNVAPGEYQLHVYHERASSETLKALERALAVASDPVAVPTLIISETGFIQVPHKNKYGKDYPAVIEDRPMYPAGTKP
jgi:plastocyanin